MMSAVARLFRRALHARLAPQPSSSLRQLQRIRHALRDCVNDCAGSQAARLQGRIEKARNAQELWLLRNDAYQVISQHHDQRVAAERINQMLPLFNGLVAPRQLSKID